MIATIKITQGALGLLSVVSGSVVVIGEFSFSPDWIMTIFMGTGMVCGGAYAVLSIVHRLAGERENTRGSISTMLSKIDEDRKDTRGSIDHLTEVVERMDRHHTSRAEVIEKRLASLEDALK